MQLGLILGSNLNLDIGRDHRNQLRVPSRNQTGPKSGLKLTCFSVHMRTERYDIVLLLFTRERNGTISSRSNFWFTFQYRPIFGPVLGTDRVNFFSVPVRTHYSIRTTFWNGPKWNGTISYPCEQGRRFLARRV